MCVYVCAVAVERAKGTPQEADAQKRLNLMLQLKYVIGLSLMLYLYLASTLLHGISLSQVCILCMLGHCGRVGWCRLRVWEGYE